MWFPVSRWGNAVFLSDLLTNVADLYFLGRDILVKFVPDKTQTVMHPIDYLAYRIYLANSNHQLYSDDPLYPIHKAMVGVVCVVMFPVQILIAVLFFPLGEVAMSLCFLASAVMITWISIHESRSYYTKEKVESLCIRYKDHKLNACPNILLLLIVIFFVLLFIVSTSILLAQFLG